MKEAPGMKVVSIGLTGGIGCGKSSVAAILEEAGWRRLDTDQVARDVVAPGTEGLTQLVNIFGQDILQSNGELDRAALGSLVFSNSEERQKLEAILHPLIWEQVENFLSECRQSAQPCVVEVPLLFENERQATFSSVWVVAASEELQRQRLRERNSWTDAEIQARVSSQMPLPVKMERADVVITNDGDLPALKSQVTSWAQNALGTVES